MRELAHMKGGDAEICECCTPSIAERHPFLFRRDQANKADIVDLRIGGVAAFVCEGEEHVGKGE